MKPIKKELRDFMSKQRKNAKQHYRWDVKQSHRTTMFAAGAAADGRFDVPYSEGEPL